MSVQEKQKQWTHPRHAVVTNMLKVVLAPYCRWRYCVTVEPFQQQGDRPYLVLYNHQTPFDQFFVGMAFRGAVYYMATEDIFSLGWISDAIRWLVNPIPIRKQTTDIQAVMNCMRIAREGGTIAIAPEGNRTYSGRTEYMNPAIAGLIKKLKLPVALFRIEGGYGVEPRWSSVIRKGKMKAYVSQVIEPEELETMTKEQVMQRVRQGLDVREDCVSGEFHHKKSAEFLDRAMYVCPDCGLAEFYSQGQIIRCTKCGWQIKYLPTKELEGVEKPFPHRFVYQWYEHQKRYVNSLDLTRYTREPMFRDTARLSEVLLYKKKNVLRKSASFHLYGNRVVIDESADNELVLPFEGISAAVALGRNKVNLYVGDTVYQVKGDNHFNALKYVNLYFRFKNMQKGEPHGEFLGL